jgi:hypothetical protein
VKNVVYVMGFVMIASRSEKLSAPKLEFQAQGHLIKIKWNVGALTVLKYNAARGAITEFSRKSRKRLLEMTARLDLKAVTRKSPVIFVTLTYGSEFPSGEASKPHLRAFLERVRRFAPQSSAVWRLEYQKRGAPHYHFIFYNLPYIPKEDLQKAWAEIIGQEYWDTSQENIRYPFTRIEMIRNPRQVMAYVSKYVAKHASEGDAVSGFINLPYPHAGRFWGVFNREFLPFAELITMSIQAETVNIAELLFQFRRLMAKKWKPANKFGRLKGASIFVDYADCWHDAFLYCLMEVDKY